MNLELLNQEVMDIVTGAQMGGHTAVTTEFVYKAINAAEQLATLDDVKESLEDLYDFEHLMKESNRYMLPENWDLEHKLGDQLSKVKHLPKVETPLAFEKETIPALAIEQLKAIQLVGKHRLSVVVGASGTGKTNAAAAVAKTYGYAGNQVFLTAATDVGVGILPDDKDFTTKRLHHLLARKNLKKADMVIVDEADLLTEHELLDLLQAVPEDCRVVLVGCNRAPYQRGHGNVFGDLIALKFPTYKLTEQVRQRPSLEGLQANLQIFETVKTAEDFTYNASFRLMEPSSKWDARNQAIRDCLGDFICEKSVEIVADSSNMVDEINNKVQCLLSMEFDTVDGTFVDGDRIIAVRTNAEEGVYAGTPGKLHIPDENLPVVICQFPEGTYKPYHEDQWKASNYDLAYAVPLELVKGQEFDRVCVVLEENNPNQTRHWLQSVLALAIDSVTICGTKDQLNQVLSNAPESPSTNLIYLTQHYKYLREADDQNIEYLVDRLRAGLLTADELF